MSVRHGGPTVFTGWVMTEPHEGGHQEDATLQLIAEFRRQWLAKEALDPGPSAPPAPVRRHRFPVVMLLLLAAVASGSLVGRLAARSGAIFPAVSPIPPAQTATLRAAGRAPLPVALRRAAGAEAAASKPSLSTAPQEAPRPALPVTPDGAGRPAGYRVQVGAFNVREYAQDLTQQLRSRDYPAMLIDVPTGPPHRVWIAGVYDRPGAKRLVGRLRRDGFDAIILPR